MKSSPPARVVITDCDHVDIDPETSILSAAGYALELFQCRTADEVIEAAREADAVITQYAPVTSRVMEKLNGCQVVVRYGVGLDNVDVDAATRLGIWVAHVPDYGVDEVAVHALTLILAQLRKIVPLYDSVRSGRWQYQIAQPLRRVSGLTFGIVGCGRIGSRLARHLSCLGARVVAVDPKQLPDDLVRLGIEQVTLEALLEMSDVVSLHVPLTDETEGMIGAPELRRMKSDAYLVNTARGGILDHTALLEALHANQIAGAALDVLDVEPPKEIQRLIRHDGVLITPHSAWYSEEAYNTLKSEVAREVVRVLHGQPPRSPVNSPNPSRRFV